MKGSSYQHTEAATSTRSKEPHIPSPAETGEEEIHCPTREIPTQRLHKGPSHEKKVHTPTTPEPQSTHIPCVRLSSNGPRYLEQPDSTHRCLVVEPDHANTTALTYSHNGISTPHMPYDQRSCLAPPDTQAGSYTTKLWRYT